MRRFLILVAACGGVSSSSTPPSAPDPAARPAPGRTMRASPSRALVDVVDALSQPRVEAGWIVPGPAQLVLGGVSLQAHDDKPREVDLLDERGNDVRVGVRLDHARFAVWTARARMLGVLAREQHISGSPNGETMRDGASIMLRAGTPVQRLSRKEGHTRIRYIGNVEVDGWVPDAALAERGTPGRTAGVRSAQRKPILISIGAPIRSERHVHARALAVAHYSMFVDSLEILDDNWQRVAYSDNDVNVRGFVHKYAAPSITHQRREPEPGMSLTPNTTVAADTCLYAAEEAVGFIVGDRPALVEPAPRIGWFTVTIDTPWGPVAFEAQGPTESSLAKCPAP